MAEWSCGRQPLRWPHLPVLRPLYNALLLSVRALTDLQLINRIQQKWWMSHPRLGYRKTVVSTLGVCLFYLLTWKEADCCAVSCPVHRFTWQGTEGAAPNNLGTEVLHPLPGRDETLPKPSGRAWKEVLPRGAPPETGVPLNRVAVPRETSGARDRQTVPRCQDFWSE